MRKQENIRIFQHHTSRKENARMQIPCPQVPGQGPFCYSRLFICPLIPSFLHPSFHSFLHSLTSIPPPQTAIVHDPLSHLSTTTFSCCLRKPGIRQCFSSLQIFQHSTLLQSNRQQVLERVWGTAQTIPCSTLTAAPALHVPLYHIMQLRVL